eukprot:CAMPEP_0204218080 /NCGR_PEP_ID=MMETSP0361-20130328/79348_1 /ASSEMBLY_ACC=CAM_ASM_000343 /TAXON_ID=268821 /ORGANISM="Scrippsiella Hangoei, Strain SHTV-5" /LENGTH=69 /DNA_ID=CAMNT_0051183159 /DNA_START=51 /DNA_END=260 /DNA_ORIENTATION=+
MIGMVIGRGADLIPDSMSEHMSMPTSMAACRLVFAPRCFDVVSAPAGKSTTVPTRWRDRRQEHNVMQGK